MVFASCMTMMVGANVECNGNKDERNQLIAAAAGSTVLQLRQRRTDGGGISAAGYVCAAFEWTLAAATPNGRSLAEVIPLSSKVRAEKLILKKTALEFSQTGNLFGFCYILYYRKNS